MLALKKSVNAENTADNPEARNSETASEPNIGVWPDLMEERIKANLESLNAQISALTHLLSQLIQDNSAGNSPTAGSLTKCTHTELSPGSEVRTYRALP